MSQALLNDLLTRFLFPHDFFVDQKWAYAYTEITIIYRLRITFLGL